MEDKTKRLECTDLWAIYSKTMHHGQRDSHVMAISFSRPLLETMIAERQDKDIVHPIYKLFIGPIPLYNYFTFKDSSEETQRKNIERILKKSAHCIGKGMLMQPLFWDSIQNPLHGFIKEDRLGQPHETLLSIAAEDRACSTPEETSEHPVQLDTWYEEGIMNA
jgi:hypothetical protein